MARKFIITNKDFLVSGKVMSPFEKAMLNRPGIIVDRDDQRLVKTFTIESSLSCKAEYIGKNLFLPARSIRSA